MSFTLVDNRRAIVTQRGVQTQATERSPRYQVVDPYQVAQPLERAGWRVRHVGKLMESRPGWSRALEIEGRAELAIGYRPVFRMLFDNAGRHALKIVPGALRLECTNAFRSPDLAWRARHDDTEKVARLLEDPVGLFEELADTCARPHRRLLSLHDVPVCEDWHDYLDRAQPRVGKIVRQAWTRLYAGDQDLWGLMQALTEVKRTGAQRVADLCLGDAYGEALSGALPEALSLELARADVARLN